MRGDYPDDNFTESDILACLERAGLRYKNGSRYILTQCPLHEDRNPSTQIFKDDWFGNCHAGCGRFHITKAFSELRDSYHATTGLQPQRAKEKSKEVIYKTFDLMAQWKEMPLIPRDHQFKTIPLEILDNLGWRWDKNSYFIPYFSASKRSIPFAQWRHLSGERRFTFLKDAKPTCYGTWNLDNHKLFVVEGTSDCAVLEYCAVPYVGLPSAASGTLMRSLANYCKEKAIQLIYAGDNDLAGEKLREALDEIMPYRVKQARPPYKDWGEMLEAEGAEAITDYCLGELFGTLAEFGKPLELEMTGLPDLLDNVKSVWPEAQELKLI